MGAILYFPIILNIFVLTRATRFNGTRIVTLMLLANVFLLVWDYDRLKYALPFYQPGADRQAVAVRKFPFVFFACVAAMAASVIVFNDLLFDIRPGNEEAECRNGCKPGKACQHFCDCIYKRGNPLEACLSECGQSKRVPALRRGRNYQSTTEPSSVSYVSGLRQS